ncbi:MAG TPA: DUF3306 domain-containing protein [Burkholderiaceae bacterium]
MKEADDSSPFLSRWSRRKTEARRGLVEEPPAEPAALVPEPPTVPAAANPALADAPPPTMADVALLNRDSDFSRFLAPGADEGVKQAAMKKLFSDPHFNVMDGLDTYIDDYGKPDPIPLAMLRRMAQSVALGLFEHEAETPPPTRLAEAATRSDSKLTPHDDNDADLQLQPDHAAGRPRPDQGAGS